MKLNTGYSSLLVLLFAGTKVAVAFQTSRPSSCFLHFTQNIAATSSNNGLIQQRKSSSFLQDMIQTHSTSKLKLCRVKAEKKRDQSLALLKSSSNNNNQKSDGVMSLEEKVAGRKKRVMMGYRVAAAIYFLLGLSTFVPGLIRPSMMPIAMNYASGPLLASGIAYILVGATENNRLSSDTYKRLNLWLSKFGFCWLLAAFLVRQSQPLTKGAKIVSNPLVVIGGLAALINGIKGWAYGSKGYDKAGEFTYLEDLRKLAKSSLEVLTSPIENVKARIYLAGTAFVGLLNLVKASEFVQMLLGMGTEAATAAKYGSWFIAFAKLQLLFMASLTLTDAAKRGRLEGTTFIELNVLSAFTWVATGGKVRIY